MTADVARAIRARIAGGYEALARYEFGDDAVDQVIQQDEQAGEELTANA